MSSSLSLPRSSGYCYSTHFFNALLILRFLSLSWSPDQRIDVLLGFGAAFGLSRARSKLRAHTVRARMRQYHKDRCYDTHSLTGSFDNWPPADGVSLLCLRGLSVHAKGIHFNELCNARDIQTHLPIGPSQSVLGLFDRADTQAIRLHTTVTAYHAAATTSIAGCNFGKGQYRFRTA